MALSDNERYTMKLKALKMLYQDNYSQTEIAQALNISRVTLNKLIEEAKKDGMVRVDIIDIRDTGKNFSVEIELYKRFNLKNVVITDCTGLDEDQTNMRIARNAADIFDRYISNNMSIGVTWGRTMKTMGTMISERQNLKNIVINSMVGGVSNVTTAIQSPTVAQAFANKLHGELYVVTAPFICSSAKLCAEIKKETQVHSVLESAKTNDINIVGIGASPEKGQKTLNVLPFNEEEIKEIYEAGAVGDIGGNFYDINGKPCKANINNRIVTISLEDLREHQMVIGVGGGKGKEKAVYGALKGGLINVLVTDLQTAKKVLELADKESNK